MKIKKQGHLGPIYFYNIDDDKIIESLLEASRCLKSDYSQVAGEQQEILMDALDKMGLDDVVVYINYAIFFKRIK